MALRAVPDHPKFAALKVRLAMPRYAVLGLLESLWHFTGRFTPQGNIGKYSDQQIEAWLEWDGEPGALINALISERWLDESGDHRIVVHDWHQHADKSTKQALGRSKQEFVGPIGKTEEVVSSSRRTQVGTVCVPPEPEPEPVYPLPPSDSVEDEDFAAPPQDGFLFHVPEPPHAVPALSPFEAKLAEVVGKLKARHPAAQSAGVAQIRNCLKRITNRYKASERIALLEKIDANHEAHCRTEKWTKAGGQYSTGLANWLAPTMERYLDGPSEPQAVQAAAPTYPPREHWRIRMYDFNLPPLEPEEAEDPRVLEVYRREYRAHYGVDPK